MIITTTRPRRPNWTYEVLGRDNGMLMVSVSGTAVVLEHWNSQLRTGARPALSCHARRRPRSRPGRQTS
jgi:hypothetical protein